MKKEYDIYKEISLLEKGDNNDKKIAFKCRGILSNESSSETLNNRLEIINNILNDYKNKK